MDMICGGPSVEVVERGETPTGIDLPYTRDSGRVDLFYLPKIIITVADSK